MNAKTAMLAIEGSPDAIIVQTDDIIRYANVAAAELFGSSSAQALVGLSFFERIHPDFRKDAQERIQKLFDGDPFYPKVAERLYLQLNGRPIWVETIGQVIEYENRKDTLIYLRNVENRKRLQMALEQERNLYERILNSIPVLVARSTLDNYTFYVNEEFTRVLGWKVQDKNKSVFDQCFPDPTYRKMVANYVARHSKEWKLLRVQSEDGSIVESRWSIVHLDDNTIISLGIDVREHLQLGRQVQELLQEKEILLREVHHRMKNNLATMTSLLTIQAEMTESPEAAIDLLNARNRIQSMTLLYEHLNRSGEPQKVNLADYLPQLSQDIITVLEATLSLRLESQVDLIEISPARASLLGIIVNEIITNAVKYAFPNQRQGIITMSCHLVNSTIQLMVGDNGIGCGDFIAHSPGLGTNLISMLTEQLEGTLIIEGTEGTRYTITIPARD